MARRRGSTHGPELGASARVPHSANQDLLRAPDGAITENGIRVCLRVGVQYLEAWLRGTGCLPLDGVRENTATAEVCRAQLWQWMRHGTTTSDGIRVTPERVEHLLLQELDRIHDQLGRARLSSGVFPSAARLFEHLIMQERFEEFLTLPAYELLN
jgi:malate synthase